MLPTIRTILYCTQLGPNAAYVFRYAVALAEKLSARVVALHVMETLTPDETALVEGHAGQDTLRPVVVREEKGAADRLRGLIAAFCAKEMERADRGDLIDRIIVAEGRTTEQILRHISEVGADLVVMGAHARSSLLAALVGSTAERVVRHSPVPVLLVQVPEAQQDPTTAGTWGAPGAS